MPRKGKLTVVTEEPQEPEGSQEDTQVVDVFSQLGEGDVEYPEDTVPGEGYSEADNPSNGWQQPDITSEYEDDPGAGPEDYDHSEPPVGFVSEPPTPDVDPDATDPPPVSVHAPELPIMQGAERDTGPDVTEPPIPHDAPTQAALHLLRLNAMTRGELMAYAADEIGIKVRDTSPKPKIIDTIMGVLVKDHVPGSIKESAVAHRTVGGTPASPSKPKMPQAKVVALGVACPGCGGFIGHHEGNQYRTTWTVDKDYCKDFTCACGVTSQMPRALWPVEAPAPAVSPTPQPEVAVPPADITPTADAATEPETAAVAA